MRNWDWGLILSAGFTILLFGIVLAYVLSRGSVDRFTSSVSRDPKTAKDEVYQTGSVRVYKFIHEGTTCFLADKQGMSASIWCK